MNLNELKYKTADFSDRTFGKDNPVTAGIHHLKEEVEELLESLENKSGSLEEFADCFIMLVDAFRKLYGNDVDMQKLIDASSDKLDVNETRTWGYPDKNGVVKHIPEEKIYQFFITNINGTTSSTNVSCADWLHAQRLKNDCMRASSIILRIDITEIKDSNII